MMKIGDMEIVVYSSPDEDFEIDWFDGLPGFSADEHEDEFTFFELMENAVLPHVEIAARQMHPLLQKFGFKKMRFVIDYSCAFTPIEAAASYLYNYSDGNAGSYLFSVSRPVLCMYLEQVVNNKSISGTSIGTTWHHEFIHAMDHRNICLTAEWDTRNDLNDLWKFYLIKYRQEGIAELYYLLKGHSSFTDLGKARDRVALDLERISGIDPGKATFHKPISDMVLDNIVFYSAGPWMVLHVLSLSDHPEVAEKAKFVASNVEDGLVVNDELVFQVIGYALNISNEEFLSGIYKPGWDGYPMIEEKVDSLGALNPLLRK